MDVAEAGQISTEAAESMSGSSCQRFSASLRRSSPRLSGRNPDRGRST